MISLPFFSWFKKYSASGFFKDSIAGLTVASVLVPQSMAYAMLANMPPIHGIYAASLPVIIASFFGSSRFLATGPVAMTALLSASVLGGMAEPGGDQWIYLMALLAILVGLIRITIGVLRLGFMVELISNSVVIGFTSAGALVIALSQMGHILGFKTVQTTHIFLILMDIISKINSVHLYTLGIGILAFVIIKIASKISGYLPGALIAVVITSFISYLYDLESKGVAIVGSVPQGFPVPELPQFEYETVSKMLGGAFVVAFFGLIEAVTIAKTLALKAGDRWDPNQELIGQGLANVVSGLIKGFPVGGSFSRSSLNFYIGAVSPLSNIISGILVILTLLYIAPAFYYLPKASLAAIVLSAVINLIRPQEILKLYRINKIDGIVAFTTFISVFFMDLWIAIMLGILTSLGSFVYKTMYPRIVVLSRDPESNTFVNAETRNLPQCPQILYIRPNTSIYFGNAQYVYDYIIFKAEERKREGYLKYVLIDMEAVNYIDASGSQTIIRIIEGLREMGVETAFANIGCDVYLLLENVNFDRYVKEDLVFDSKGHSIRELIRKIDHEYCRKNCPYEVFRECGDIKKGIT